MKLLPDALLVGPLVIAWGRLALVLGLVVFLLVVGRKANPKLDSAAWWAVVAAVVAGRLGYVGLNWSDLSSAGWPELLRAGFDIRSGGLLWPLALGAGLVVLLGRLRAQVLELVPAFLIAAVATVLPLLLRPAQAAGVGIDPNTTLVRLEPGGTHTSLTWANLPKPVLLNFWATWCPPCRAEMPLLSEYAQKGYAIVLLNDGETPAAIESYLKQQHLEVPIYQAEGLYRQLGIAGLPTTLKIEPDGQISARHLGALNRAELEQLLE